MGTRKTELDKAIERLEAEKAAVQRSIDVLKVLSAIYLLPVLVRESWLWCQETFDNEPAELDRVIDFEKRRAPRARKQPIGDALREVTK